MYIGTLQKCNVNANLNGQNLVVMVRSKVTAEPIWAELLGADIQSRAEEGTPAKCWSNCEIVTHYDII